MKNQQPSNEIQLVPMKKEPSSIDLMPTPEPKKQGLTRIEKYNVEEMCWKLYIHTSKDPKQISHMLNKHLDAKRDAYLRSGKIDDTFHFPVLTYIDVRLFLEGQKERLEKYLGQQRKRMAEETFDVIKNLQELVVSTRETLDMWKAKLEDSLNRGDDKKLMQAATMLHRERSQMQSMIEKMAQLLGKVKTYISMDVMQEQVMSIAEIIEHDDTLPEDARIHLLQRVMQTMELSVVTKAIS